MSENIRVIVRFRPLNKKEENNPTSTEFKLNVNPASGSIDISNQDNSKKNEFIFDKAFDEKTSQEQLFNDVARNAVEWVCEGYNSTIFTYGNTSSGKTFTMFGHENGKRELRGIIPRACETLFQIIDKKEDVVDASMKCSFIEIYREHIRNLLCKDSDYNPDLRIRQHETKGIYIQSLIEKFVYTPSDILDAIKEGALQRSTASTALNSVSSRSHAVLTLTLTQSLMDGSATTSKLHLIDLAGSENVGKSEAQGTTLAEAQTINKSLSCLANVIYALTEKGREHIPYRDSKLTYILQDSLGGNSKTIIIATASPSVLSYSETINTLRFAQRAKLIKNIPKVNKNESNANLLKTIEVLNARIAELESKCNDSNIIFQAVEQASEDNKETELFKARCLRLEEKIENYKKEKIENDKRLEEYNEVFDKQRMLAIKAAKALCIERVAAYYIKTDLEQYRSIYNNMKEISNCKILELMVQNAKIISKSGSVSIPEMEVELDSPKNLF